METSVDRSRPPAFTVIVCTRNEEDRISACLDSLLASTYPLDRVQILVCDGRSTDATRSIVQRIADEYDCVRLLDNPGLTAPRGFNLGVESATGDVIAILSAHAEAAPDWIEQCIKALQEHPEVAGVGGEMATVGEGRGGAVIADALSCPFGVGYNRFRVGGKPGYADTVVFGAYRRDTFKTYGGFDEELARNQDDEFNYRLRSRGAKLWFDPRIRSTYCARSSLRLLYRQYAQYGFWKPLVYRKCPGTFAWRQLMPPAFVVSLAVASVLGFFWAPAWWALAAIGGLYVSAAAALSARIAMRLRSCSAVALPLAFLTIHLAYGAHFLSGFLYFRVLGLAPRARHAKLTRAGASREEPAKE